MLHYEQSESGWLTLVTANGLAVVDQRTEARALWDALVGPDGIRGVLDRLTKAGLLDTPAFALLEWTGDLDAGPVDLRSIVRGEVKLTVRASGSERVVSASDVSTWLEQTVRGVAGFQLRVGAAGASAGADDGELLPLIAGVVVARRVVAGAATEMGAATEAGAATEVGEATVAEPLETIRESLETMRAGETASEYDHLFGATVVRGVEDAAVRPEDADPAGRDDDDAVRVSQKIGVPAFVTGTVPPPSVPPSAQPGDHDGLTVFSGDIQKLRKEQRTNEAETQQPAFFLELADGAREAVGSSAIVGRAPSAARVPGDRIPRLITVGDGDHDISRSHVMFTVEGDTVVATDLHSRNGTMVILPGKSPQKLRQGEPTSIIVDTVVDLGGGVAMTVREG